MKVDDLLFMPLNAKKIMSVDTQKGYMQVLEYTLQDLKTLHVVQWHFCTHFLDEVTDEVKLLPTCFNETFYDCKDKAFEYAEKLGNDLLRKDF